MTNQPFPEDYDFRDGKRTVLRLNPARVNQMRDTNRNYYAQLRELSVEAELAQMPNLQNQNLMNTSLRRTATPTADQTNLIEDSGGNN